MTFFISDGMVTFFIPLNICESVGSVITIELTRTKTSIRYTKENDKEKRERRKERERKVEGKI